VRLSGSAAGNGSAAAVCAAACGSTRGSVQQCTRQLVCDCARGSTNSYKFI
jgi:hypothetical protein